MQEVKQFRKITQSVKIQFVQFQATTINQLAESLVLGTIHSRMENFGYSDKIIQGTTITRIEIFSSRKFRIFFSSDYKTKFGFDVALAREKTGTVRHFIKPVDAKALSFIVGGFVKGFSKGHFVKGITPSHIIENTLNELAEPFLDEYIRTEKNWLQQNYGGLATIAI